jgi:hypothetical protein
LGDEGQPDRKKNNVLARKRLLPTKSFNQHHTYFRVGLIGRGLGYHVPLSSLSSLHIERVSDELLGKAGQTAMTLTEADVLDITPTRSH